MGGSVVASAHTSALWLNWNKFLQELLINNKNIGNIIACEVVSIYCIKKIILPWNYTELKWLNTLHYSIKQNVDLVRSIDHRYIAAECCIALCCTAVSLIVHLCACPGSCMLCVIGLGSDRACLGSLSHILSSWWACMEGRMCLFCSVCLLTWSAGQLLCDLFWKSFTLVLGPEVISFCRSALPALQEQMSFTTGKKTD